MIPATLGVYLHQMDPFAWRISGDFGVRWYGLAYAAGFACAYVILRTLAKRGIAKMKPEQVSDFMVAVVLGVLLGGRVGWVLLYNPSALWTVGSSFPYWEAIAINQGGMASHGGIAGVIIAVAWWCRRNQIGILHQLDMAALVTPFGLGFGRLANFVNGELYGNACSEAFAWAVRFPQEMSQEWGVAEFEKAIGAAGAMGLTQAQWLDIGAKAGAGNAEARGRMMELVGRMEWAVREGNAQVTAVVEPLLTPRYPSQLFQAVAEGAVLAALLWGVLIFRRPRKPGVIGALFVVGYAILRIATEHWRQPDIEIGRLWLGLSEGQWLSAGMLAAGLVSLWVVVTRDAKETGQ